MSRGLGKVQRAILAHLNAAGEPTDLHTMIAAIEGGVRRQVTASVHTSYIRALHGLAKARLIAKVGTRREFTAEYRAAGVDLWLPMRPALPILIANLRRDIDYWETRKPTSNPFWAELRDRALKRARDEFEVLSALMRQEFDNANKLTLTESAAGGAR